ncbi:peptidoglycan-recognition protein SC1a-like [Schistocerca gregaria]|uniref:peptidoglycan-recognition protein SC1a-like n=1 Tax=Schistocerca gregaria TaxID=7010 RepID=UPI00211E1395|nr:peptidoglycan-recognition protein SC1a-like [Schistocerca gregaria]
MIYALYWLAQPYDTLEISAEKCDRRRAINGIVTQYDDFDVDDLCGWRRRCWLPPSSSSWSSWQECCTSQTSLQELHWQMYQQPEISYNFLIDSSGNIYEGLGWNGTNTSKSFVSRCKVDVALIGNYMEHNMTRQMSSALRWLLDEGVRTGMLAAEYRLLAHNQVKKTLSPGRWALMEIADWPHRCRWHCDRGVPCIRPADGDDSSGQ